MDVLFVKDVFSQVRSNTKFRKYLYSDGKLQVVEMHLVKDGGIHLESHPSSQLFLIIEGRVIFIIKGEQDDRAVELTGGGLVIIPAGKGHQVIAVEETYLLTTYSPQEHQDPEDEETSP